jgi:hypothetical protein
MIRQGDILLVPVTHTPHLDFFLYGPSGVQMTPDDFAEAAVVERVVLAEGEATEHQHVMLGDLRVMRKPWFGQERMVIWVRRGAITHPDHDPPQSIPPGWYGDPPAPVAGAGSAAHLLVHWTQPVLQPSSSSAARITLWLLATCRSCRWQLEVLVGHAPELLPPGRLVAQGVQ